MNRKKHLLFFLCLLVVVFSGCWEGRDLNQRAFITGIAFDMPKEAPESEPEEFLVSIQIPIPEKMAGEAGGGGGGEVPPFLVFGTTANSVSNSLIQLQRQLDRKLFLGHTRLILIGEELAKKIGIERVVDYFKRNFQVQRMTRMAIVEGEAKEVLSIKPPVGQTTSTYILNLISDTGGSSLSYLSDIGKFLVYNADEGLDPVLPKIKIKNDVVLTGGAGIIKNSKLVGYLTPFETRGLNILMNEFKESVYRIECPIDSGEMINIGVVSTSTDFNLLRNNGELVMDSKITGSFETREFSGHHGPLESIADGMRKATSLQIQQETKAAINKAQEVGADIFGIGKRIQALYPDMWEKMDWGHDFPHFPIRIKVDLIWSQTVRRLGE